MCEHCDDELDEVLARLEAKAAGLEGLMLELMGKLSPDLWGETIDDELGRLLASS